MLKKLLLLTAVVILILVLSLNWRTENVSGERITEELEIQELFETRCGICHNGASPEAPRVSSLKLLPEAQILAALKTGVMKNQAAMLSDKQHKELAAYISEVDAHSESNTIVKGLCSEEMDLTASSSSAQINNWGMGLESHRYQDAENLAIKASNVAKLELDWAFAFPNASRARVQPTISGNTLFTASQQGTIYALNRKTGCIQWTFQADAEVRSALVIGRDSIGQANRLYFGDFNAQLYALDLQKRKLLWKKKADDHPVATITGSLNLYNDKLYVPISSTEVVSAAIESYVCCSFRGAVASFDTKDGSLLWKTQTIAESPKEVGKTAKGIAIMAPSGAPVWTSVTIDTQRNCLYVGTGENYTRPASQTSDAILAFSLTDGELLWSQQTISKDAWNGACVTLDRRANCPEDNGPDADFGATPILVKREAGDLILAGQKSGWVYALDPDNKGAIVWKQLVGRGGMMGGIHWGMATNGEELYVPINDGGVYGLNTDKEKSPGMHALNIADGKILWSTLEEDRCKTTLRGCGPGISAAITLTPEVVFGGALDGVLKAYATDNGRELWSFDTKQDYEAVNGVKAFGGAIDSDGPVIVEDQVFITSGYAKFSEIEGNVLLCFSLKE
ncbi:MAG: PQQ-binding-like beta-propeller repeat protein [Bacteroidia bacterium]|nr:PQQ-binding-like beta-propeller repeat protein [Bacteroidia bacterium]